LTDFKDRVSALYTLAWSVGDALGMDGRTPLDPSTFDELID
jgi:hypothetical protein